MTARNNFFTISDAHYVPTYIMNLLSTTKLKSKGIGFDTGTESLRRMSNGAEFGRTVTSSGLHVLQTTSSPSHMIFRDLAGVSASEGDVNTWHRRYPLRVMCTGQVQEIHLQNPSRSPRRGFHDRLHRCGRTCEAQRSTKHVITSRSRTRPRV